MNRFRQPIPGREAFSDECVRRRVAIWPEGAREQLEPNYFFSRSSRPWATTA